MLTSRLLHVNTLIGQRRPFFLKKENWEEIKMFLSYTYLNLEYNAMERTYSKETMTLDRKFLDICFILKLRTGSTTPVFVT